MTTQKGVYANRVAPRIYISVHQKYDYHIRRYIIPILPPYTSSPLLFLSYFLFDLLSFDLALLARYSPSTVQCSLFRACSEVFATTSPLTLSLSVYNI